jgi:predicted MFS family arabinose efflux permease
VGGAAACFAAIMGFSRLAYGVLVPAMRSSIGGSFALYGAIGGANMLGYLAGSLLTTRLARRPDRARVNTIALVVMSVAMAACGLAAGAPMLAILRFAVGVASGIALALTLSLAVEHIPAARRGLAAAIVWGGGCAGIAITGLAGRYVAPGAWRIEWMAMGIAGLLVAAIYARMTGGTFAAAERADDGGAIGIFAKSRYLALSVAYFAFGVGYIDVVTFFGAALGRAHGMSVATTWTVLGLAGIAGVAIWGPLVDRFRSGVPVGFACATCALGALLVARGNAAAAVAGAVAIGISFIGVPAMVGALLQQREPGVRYPRAFASVTVVLGVGQIVGPLVGGLIADAFGTSNALVAGAAALAFAAGSALLYRRPAGIAPADAGAPTRAASAVLATEAKARAPRTTLPQATLRPERGL